SSDIAQANGTQLEAEAAALTLNASSWLAFRNNSEDRDAVATLVQESRDPFATERDNGAIFDYANKIAKYASGDAVIAPEPLLLKTSTKTVLKDNDHWDAQDSLDFDTRKCVGPDFLCSDDWSLLPLGYGRAGANSDGGEGDQLCDYSYFSFAD